MILYVKYLDGATCSKHSIILVIIASKLSQELGAFSALPKIFNSHLKPVVHVNLYKYSQ